MSQPEPEPRRDQPQRMDRGARTAAAERGRVPLRRWQKVLLAVAGAMLAIGLVLALVEGGGNAPAGGAAPPGGAALVGGEAAPASGADEVGWSPMFLKMGFGFFIGFAVGYVLRLFLKVVLLIAGAVALSLFGLAQLGLVEVHWQQISELFDSLMGHVRDQASGLRRLFTGSLPAAGLSGLGLFTGFRKA